MSCPHHHYCCGGSGGDGASRRRHPVDASCGSLTSVSTFFSLFHKPCRAAAESGVNQEEGGGGGGWGEKREKERDRERKIKTEGRMRKFN